MRIISFGWTTPALLAGVKTVTRRDWSPSYAASFRAGDELAAWNRLPRVKAEGADKPHQVAVIRLTAAPELSDEYPESDYDREGLRWLDEHGYWMPDKKIRNARISPLLFWVEWKEIAPPLYVVRFEVVEYLEEPLA